MNATGLDELLSLVSKPVRYLGKEVNSIKKDPSRVRLRFCLAFPDVYEVGMSHLGIQILYQILNKKEWISCERVFAPWVDMERILREKEVTLYSLESKTPLKNFDILGFSLQYELCFTNFLNILDLSQIPLFSKERDERFPLVIGGGPITFNPAPVADFFDALVIGDGEEVILEVCEITLQWKESHGKKDDLLESLSQIKGVYVPLFHSKDQKVQRRLIPDLNKAPFPLCPIVPYMRIIHDRLNIEIARGCKRGCRFCQAGFIHRPYRERSADVVKEIIIPSLKYTGYEEVSLLSLSAGDYSFIKTLLPQLMDQLEKKRIALSFPSLRIESIVGQIAEEIKRVRKTGLTIAPEASTERLQKVINKEMKEDILFQGLFELFSKGWKNLKLYFMIGLPTEREEDVRGIVDLSKRLLSLSKRTKTYPNITISISTFVPKPHTPFQWESQIPLEEMEEKLSFLREGLKKNHLRLKWQDPHLSLLEGVFSMGDQRLSEVLVEAYRLGCRFDGWSDQFRYDLWEKAFDKVGLNMKIFNRRKELQEILPWAFIDTGISISYLWNEHQKSQRGEPSPPCSTIDCHRCGICDGERIFLRENISERILSIRSESRREFRKEGNKWRYHLSFTKKGSISYISHLELSHLFYRASRRADLPLFYSQGYHPMPRIIFSKALPVGVESLSESVDIELERRIHPEEVMKRLNQNLPHGIEVIEARIASPFTSSPQSFRSVYLISLNHFLSKEEAISGIKNVLDSSEFLITQNRKGKTREIDIRPLIESMELKEEDSGLSVELVIRETFKTSAKPLEIIEAVLNIKGEELHRCRVKKIE